MQHKVLCCPGIPTAGLVWFASTFDFRTQKEMAALTPKELVNLLNIIEEVLCVAQLFEIILAQFMVVVDKNVAQTGDRRKEHTGESLQQAASVLHQAGSFQGGILSLRMALQIWKTLGGCSC